MRGFPSENPHLPFNAQRPHSYLLLLFYFRNLRQRRLWSGEKVQDEQAEQAALRVRARLLQHHLEGTRLRLGRKDLQRRVRAAEGEMQRPPGPGRAVPGEMQE